MQMAIEANKDMLMSRRRIIKAIAAYSASSLAWGQDKKPSQGNHLVAAWEHEARFSIGILRLDRNNWSVVRSFDLPTRPHGFFCEAGGSVLAVARRPGEWLLRWNWHTGSTQWSWVDDDRRLNGHVISSQDGRTLLTTETDQSSGRGLLGIRSTATMEKTQEFDTHGLDPHQLVILPKALGRCPAGTVIVANGGVRTFAETGRMKASGAPLDSSLVALSPTDGRLLGQWRLPDPFLSIRHLAWNNASGRLGIALQSEHPDKTTKEAAPVLAVWDGEGLRIASGQPTLQGYGGDIVSMPGSGFAVSCPKANVISLYDALGNWKSVIEQSGVCALAPHEGGWLAAGNAELTWNVEKTNTQPFRLPSLGYQWDNHWLAV